MSDFALKYTRDAENQLAGAWLDADDRPAVTRAETEIGLKLMRDPKTYGVELAEGLWKIVVAPLRIYFEIDELEHEVTVTKVAKLPSP